MPARIKVTGLTELIHDLERVGGNPRQVMRSGDHEVVDRIKSAESAQANSRQRRRSIKSNEHKPTATGIEVTVGGAGGDKEWAAGAQFGSSIAPAKGFKRARVQGYVTIPAIRKRPDEVADPWLKAIVEAMEK
jgi:hypothetical protein